ncbi:MAG: hypothetical protein SF029_22910 [bacterium]|nr:hypothetical protein [bacterium]
MPKSKPVKIYSSDDGQAAASKFGQMLGDAFASVVYQHIQRYLARQYPQYVLLEPEDGRKLVKFDMLGGTLRQLDNVIIEVNSIDPVALFETKWLKDGRHHNDKGAWILQLREISRRHPTVRGMVANLAGYWTEGVRVMFESEGRVRMVLVATDVEVYSTLQPHIDTYTQANHLEALKLDNIRAIRNRLPRAWDLANCLAALKQAGVLDQIAQAWLSFERDQDAGGNPIDGAGLIEAAIDKVLKPLPENPRIVGFEISLQVESGNVIHQGFTDLEEALEFMQRYTTNPQAVLETITPKEKASASLEEEIASFDEANSKDLSDELSE